jgi:hypothetical protein
MVESVENIPSAGTKQIQFLKILKTMGEGGDVINNSNA